MSEEQTQQEAPAEEAKAPEATEQAAETSNSVKLNGGFAFKVGMSQIYDEKGEIVPVTVLRWEPWVVSQIKTQDKDGYTAVQIAGGGSRKVKNSSKASLGHLKKAGLSEGTRFVREIRQELPEGVKVGQEVSIESFAGGDTVKMTAKSKGRGFAGVMKRWNFGGGPAAHGSTFHRQPGSSGNRTWPGRVVPGKKYPGHFGDETITTKNVQIVQVIPEENVLLVKGPVPGARNTLVKLSKQDQG